jgi:L-lysine exporter family protein LysE/ArgO
MLFAYFNGMATGGALIIAIGAQNAFVLSQGLKKNHILVIPTLCALCDAVLVMAGVTGMGRVVASSPALTKIAGAGGALFLFCYGFKAFYSALQGNRLETEAAGTMPLKTAVLATLGVSLLNPHAYLDTIVLLGSISGQFPAPAHMAFGAGAVSASFLWFFILSLGAGFLAPLFRTPAAWRIMDAFVGAVMWGIAATLVSAL